MDDKVRDAMIEDAASLISEIQKRRPVIRAIMEVSERSVKVILNEFTPKYASEIVEINTIVLDLNRQNGPDAHQWGLIVTADHGLVIR